MTHCRVFPERRESFVNDNVSTYSGHINTWTQHQWKVATFTSISIFSSHVISTHCSKTENRPSRRKVRNDGILAGPCFLPLLGLWPWSITVSVFRTFGLATAHRWNFGHRHQSRLDRNGCLRHRRAPYGVPCRRYGPGGGLRRRHAHRQHHHRDNHWVQRRYFLGVPGPSTRAVEPRKEAPVIPQEALWHHHRARDPKHFVNY